MSSTWSIVTLLLAVAFALIVIAVIVRLRSPATEE